MPRKNFKSATTDIFGDYQNPTTNTKEKAAKKTKSNYELFLLSIQKHQLDLLKKEAKDNNVEVKDVLSNILEKHFDL